MPTAPDHGDRLALSADTNERRASGARRSGSREVARRDQDGEGEAAADEEAPALLDAAGLAEVIGEDEAAADGDATGAELALGVLPGLQATTAPATVMRRTSRFSMQIPQGDRCDGAPAARRSDDRTLSERTLLPHR